MALFKNGLDQAAAEVRKLRDARSKLDERERAAMTELAALRESLPDIALEAALSAEPTPDATKAHNRVLVLEYELKTCTAARRALFPRLEAAMKAVNVARAGEIRKRVAKLQSEFAQHKEQSDKLRVALENHESAFFAPAPMAMRGDITSPVMLPNVTRSEKMRLEIEELERKAVATEQAGVNVGGSADGCSSLEELLRAIDECPDDTIAPLSSEVEAWFAEGLARADAEWNGTGRRRGDPEPMTAELSGFEKYRSLSVSLVWLKDGVIDTQHSAVRYSNRFEIPRELAAEHGAVYAAPLSD